MKRIALLSLCLILSACANLNMNKQPKMVSGNTDGMSYSYDGSYEQLNMVTQRAMSDCQKFGRFAVLKNTGQVEDSHLANFNCVTGCP